MEQNYTPGPHLMLSSSPKFVTKISHPNLSPKFITKIRHLYGREWTAQGLVFKGILKGQESKSWDFFEGSRRFRGPQKSEKIYFLKRTKTSVDHKFKSFAIN